MIVRRRVKACEITRRTLPDNLSTQIARCLERSNSGLGFTARPKVDGYSVLWRLFRKLAVEIEKTEEPLHDRYRPKDG